MPRPQVPRRRRRRRLRALLQIAVALAAVEVAVVAYLGDRLRRLDLDTVDARFTIRGPEPAPRDIVVVRIDDETFAKVGRRYADWPRTYHARVVRELKRDGARAIAYDVQFTGRSRNHDDDLVLAQAAYDARPVVLAATSTDGRGGTDVLGGDQVLRAIGARAGNALFPDDPGKVLRRMECSIDGLDAFSVAIVEAETKRSIPCPHGRLWIDYAGPEGTFRSIPFWRVLRHQVPDGFFRGATVVVGPTSEALQDVHPTPEGSLPGPEIQANAIRTVREGFPLRSVGRGWDVLAIVLLGIVAPLASLRLSGLRALPMAALAGAFYVVVAQLRFDQGRVMTVAYPIAALALGAFGALAVDYFTETREKRRMRVLFGRFVPESVVDDVISRADDDLRLEGVRLDATVMFSDLRDFTGFAQTLEPRRVIDVLNRYLGEMSEAILDHGGTLVSYMGDGIMAVFGAPIEQDDHADRALAAAREMLEVRLPRFNAWLGETGVDRGFKMGIGLNSGPVMSGNVGSQRRLEYTAVGDTTNTAARLEGLTKGTEHQLFVSDATRERLHGGAQALIRHGELSVRGREATVLVWVVSQETLHRDADPG